VETTNNFKEAITKIWNHKANDWNRRSENMWERGSRKDIIPFIEKHVPNGSSVLDVGCGSGYSSKKLHEKGYHVTGVDISDEMIQLAKRSSKSTDITFHQADVNSLPFEKETFDAMVTINVLEWTNIPAHALREMTRALKYDGYLCVGILGPTAGPRAHSYDRVYGKGILQNTMMPWEFSHLSKEFGYILIDEMPVWKNQMSNMKPGELPIQLQQAISFMWVFILQKKYTNQMENDA